MFTRKVDRQFLRAPHWCAIAIVLSCAAVADAQFGGMGMGAAPAEQRLFPGGLPKMDVMLKGALEHHPDVLAARSKIRAAEAEQRQAELKALKEIVELRDRWSKANRSMQAANNNVVSGVKGADPAAVSERLADLAAVEWELAFLLGTRGDLASGSKGVGENGAVVSKTGADSLPVPAMVETAIPRGEQAKALKKGLGQQIALNIDEMPITEFVKVLSEKSGIRFLLDKQSLENEGFPADSPVSIELGELELGAVVQVLEDVYKPLYFIVRDYGVLVTGQNEQSSKNISVNDFWKLSEEELRDKLQHQRQEELNGPTGGGGGFF